jgi:hypothetical protein
VGYENGWGPRVGVDAVAKRLQRCVNIYHVQLCTRSKNWGQLEFGCSPHEVNSYRGLISPNTNINVCSHVDYTVGQEVLFESKKVLATCVQCCARQHHKREMSKQRSSPLK